MLKEEQEGELVRLCSSDKFPPSRINLYEDILKALCLGATAVGMGRPFLYAQSVCSQSDSSLV